MLPNSLIDGYEYVIVEIANRMFLVAASPEWLPEQRPSVIESHCDALRMHTGLPIIMLFGSMPAYIFQRCTRRNIDIMVGEKRIFLPSLLFITESVNLSKDKSPKKIPSMVQLMILYHLQRERLDGLNTEELAAKLRTSYATVNRALRWCKEKELIRLDGEKEKTVQFLLSGKELWQTALPYLESPVTKTVRTNSVTWLPNALSAGTTALGLPPEEGAPLNCLAVSTSTFSDLKTSILYAVEYVEKEIEVWRYDPTLLSDVGTVDILSLYLSLRNTSSPQVQEELNALMAGLDW